MLRFLTGLVSLLGVIYALVVTSNPCSCFVVLFGLWILWEEWSDD